MLTNKLIELGLQKRNKELRHSNGKELSWYEVGLACGVEGDNIGEKARCFVKSFVRSSQVSPKENVKEENNYKETIEINSNGSQVSDKAIKMSVKESKDANFLLEQHGYCNKEFELVSAKSSIWNVQSKESGIKKLYASKITVKKRTDTISME